MSAATRHVVLLFDERVELPGLSLLDAELVRTLRSNFTEPVEVYREAMDLSRFSSNSYKTLLRDFLRAKYADKKIDVAVAIMAPAFDFLLAYGDLIFPGTPIVFSGLDRQQLGTRSLPPNVYGVLIKREFAPTLDLVLRVHPTTEHFVVVAGTSDYDTSKHKKSFVRMRTTSRLPTSQSFLWNSFSRRFRCYPPETSSSISRCFKTASAIPSFHIRSLNVFPARQACPSMAFSINTSATGS